MSRMKFGLISLDFKRFSLEYCFKMARRYGLDGVELWGGRPHGYFTDMTQERLQEIDALKKKYKLEIPMYTPNALNGPYNLCSLEERTIRETLEFFQRSIDNAYDLECPRMLVVADHPGYEAPKALVCRRFIENMQYLCDYGAPKGVSLVIEPLTPMESPVITTADDCVDAIKRIGRDNVEAMMDVAPPTVANEPFSVYFDKLKDRMNYIHICNNDGMTDAHKRLDQGIIPIKDMFTVFTNWKYNGYVTCELYSENYRDPELYLANTMRMVYEIRNELGI